MSHQHNTATRSGILLAAAVSALLVPSAAHAQVAAPSANERAVTDRYLTTVHAELTGKIDSRTAKPGQEIAVRLLEDARLADGTSLPKGARLLGTVTMSQAQGAQQGGALLVLTLDRADLQGRILLVRSVIQMLTPPPGARSTADQPSPMAMPLPSGDDVGIAPASSGSIAGPGTTGVGTRTSIDPTGAGPMGSGSIPTGTNQGGVLRPGQEGGVYGGDDSGMNSPLGGVPITSRPMDNLGVVAAPARQVRPVVSAGENVSGRARTTGIPGVMLRRDGAPDASGVLTAMGHNIVLESGTRITLGVISR